MAVWFSAISFDLLASRWYQTLKQMKMDAGECYLSKSVKFCGAPLEPLSLCLVHQNHLNFPFFPLPLVGSIGQSIFSAMNIPSSVFRSRVSSYMCCDPSARELLATIWTINLFLFLISVVSVLCCWDLCTSEKSPRCRWLIKRQGLSLLAVGLEPCRFRLHASSDKNTSILKRVAELQILDELLLDPSSVVPDTGLLCLKGAQVLSVP